MGYPSGRTGLVTSNAVGAVIAKESAWDGAITDLASHEADTANPHVVTKAQVGLANAENTTDLNKPISTAQQTALNLKRNTADQIDAIDIDVSDSHNVLDTQQNLQLTIDQIDQFIYHARSTGVSSFDGLSINGGTPANVDKGAGEGEIFILSTGVFKHVTWPASINEVISNTGVAITYHYIHDDNNDGIGTHAQTITPFTDSDQEKWIFLGTTAFGGGAIVDAESKPTVLQHTASTLREFMEEIGVLHSGLTISSNGSNLSLDKAAGYIFGYGANYDDDRNSRQKVPFVLDTLMTFAHGNQAASLLTPTTLLDVGNYNPTGSTISAVGGPPATSTIFAVYSFDDGVTIVLYGQDTYPNLAAAESALESYEPSVQGFFSTAARTTFIAVRRDATDLSDPTEAIFTHTNKFGLLGGGISAAAEGALIAANNFSDLDNLATALINLNLVIGTNVQAWNAILDATTASFLTAQATKVNALNQGVATTDSPSFVAVNGRDVAADGALLDKVKLEVASFRFHGDGGVIANGLKKGVWEAPYAGSFTDWSFFGDMVESGNATISVLTKNGTDILGAGAKPLISAGTDNTGSNMTGITVTFVKGDKFKATLSGVTVFTNLNLNFYNELT